MENDCDLFCYFSLSLLLVFVPFVVLLESLIVLYGPLLVLDRWKSKDKDKKAQPVTYSATACQRIKESKNINHESVIIIPKLVLNNVYSMLLFVFKAETVNR